MTDAHKDWIDNASYEDLLRGWRFGVADLTIFQGATGAYYAKVMHTKRDKLGCAEHVATSKKIGWER